MTNGAVADENRYSFLLIHSNADSIQTYANATHTSTLEVVNRCSDGHSSVDRDEH